jgi:hypothetical protein
MTAFVVLLLLGYIGYRVSKRSCAQKRSWRFFGPAYLPKTGHLSVSPAAHAQLRGDAGEAAVHAELLRVLTWLCRNDFHLHDGPVLVEHAPGTDFPTAEIDHLAVTPFGIFVFETKNWGGRIEPGDHDDDLALVHADDMSEARRSPLAQNRTKVAFLDAKLPRLWPIEGLGVFASPSCTLNPDLPPTLLHISELAYCLRLRRHEFMRSGRKPVNVSTAWKSILLVALISKDAIDIHRKRVRANPKVRERDAV